MTSEEKMRKEFDAYLKRTRRVEPRMLSDGSYDSPVQDCCWEFWKASRESLVIELPNPISEFNKSDNGFVNPEAQGYDDAIEDCRKSIHAAGVKTK